ncbi:unnamed protein product [Coffea canephora]|uniref:KIB1-4 beta-propeller domain-containing protein n=1 Tax=Coffea canephora TaxID=49390 RepID=A0A068UUW8_COFCA|nr:unnamed protein product [Coffea canephora]
MANWCELQYDMLEVIAQHLTKIEDYVAFGAVCTSWRAAAANKKKNFRGIPLWKQIPCLMVAAKDENDVGDREFYSLLENEVVAKVNLPKLKGKRYLEALGWLLLIGEEGDMSLLNPFSSGPEIPLPNQNTIPGYDRYEPDAFIFVEKFALSARPSEAEEEEEKCEDYVVMLICGSVRFLAFWKPGDQSWNRVVLRVSVYSDVTYYNGQIYAVDKKGNVVVCNPKNNGEARILATLCYRFWDLKQLYIAESEREESLLVVTRDNFPFFDDDAEDREPRYGTAEFKVFEMDLSAGGRGGAQGGSWSSSRLCLKEIKSLGNRALFLGHSATVSFEVSSNGKLAPGIKPNHIYFTDDCWLGYGATAGGGGKDMGVYNMETGTVEPFYHAPKVLSYICPSAWITPNF